MVFAAIGPQISRDRTQGRKGQGRFAMKNQFIVFTSLLTAAASLGPRVALGQDREAAKPDSTSVPVNIGLVPYADVNSHFARPKNSLSVDGIVGLTSEI